MFVTIVVYPRRVVASGSVAVRASHLPKMGRFAVESHDLKSSFAILTAFNIEPHAPLSPHSAPGHKRPFLRDQNGDARRQNDHDRAADPVAVQLDDYHL